MAVGQLSNQEEDERVDTLPIAPDRAPDVQRKPLYARLHVQMTVALILGVLVGHLFPSFGISLKPLGDIFIKLIKMVVPAIIFVNIVHGIAGSRNLALFGRVAGTAMGYFLIVSTLALLVGLFVGNLVQPGVGMNVDVSKLDAGAISGYAERAHDQSVGAFLSSAVPTTLVSSLVDGNLLQVIMVSVLFGLAIVALDARVGSIVSAFEDLIPILFKITGYIMHFAPIGVFGAMAYTIGEYGLASLWSLAGLVGLFYATALGFVVVVFGLIAHFCGFSIFRLVAYIRTELLVILGTSSSETAMPNLMEKLERAGCQKSIVGLVLPMGYSFNLDGTNIYITLAALFVANACGIDLSFADQLLLLGVAVVSSKGAAGVPGAGFVILAATLAIVPTIPLAGMALLLGIERFMGVCCALVNFTGNALATIVVAKWNGALDSSQLDQALAVRSRD